MIRKITLKILPLLLFFGLHDQLKGQGKVEYKERFAAGTTYCPTDAPYANWVTFVDDLDTNTYKFRKVTMASDYNATAVAGRTCSDYTKVMELANALKNKLTYSTTCDGNVWATTYQNCQVGGGCASLTDNIMISAAGTATCACNNQWILNPTIGNANAVAVGVANCPGRAMEVRLTFSAPDSSNNLNVTLDQGLNECDRVQDLKAKFENLSLTPTDSIEVYYSINGTQTGPVKLKPNKLAFCKDTTLTFASGVNFSRNTAYNIEVFIHSVNTTKDSFNEGDTSRFTLNFLGAPDPPVAMDKTICGNGEVLLEATPDLPSDSIAWYRDKAGTDFIGLGKSIMSPFLASNATYTFWAYPFAGLVFDKITTTFAGGNGQSGNMFDVRAVNFSIDIDTIELHIGATGSEAYEIYVREGSYTDAGATTTASMWTLQQSGNVAAAGVGNPTKVPFDFLLESGKQYAMYVTLTNSTNIDYTNGTNNQNDGYIAINAGVGKGYPFGGTFNPRSWNGSFIYKVPVCPGPPDSAVITVNQKPIGASFDEVAGFQKAPKNGGLGIQASPHVVALGDTLKYDFTNPTGFATADLGSTWTIDNVSITTESGRDVSTTSVWTPPSGSTAGRLTYTPDTITVDSNVQACITFTNTATNCDSTVCTYIYVAPLPDPSYTRAQKICDGDVIAFTNTSTIKSGFMNHKWYFGDGDSTDAPDPVKQYATNGTYYLTYNAISSLYGYIRTVLDTVEVTQIPQVAFKIANVCEGGTHTFTNNTTVAAGVLSYIWDYGDGNGSTNSAMVHTHNYASKGRYNVTLKAEANGCSAELTKNAYSFPNPEADITAPTSGILCSNKPVPFGNNSTISSGTFGHLWDMGDNNLQTTKTLNYQYAGPGTYKVLYTAISEFGCEGKDSTQVTIQNSPKVDFNFGQACDLTPTDFTDATTGIAPSNPTYTWDLGDGNSSGAQNPSHQYTSIGPKVVNLKVVLDNGCEDQITKTVLVKTQPSVDFAVADGCFDKGIPFDNKTKSSSGTINYDWRFGDGDSAFIADPIHTYKGTSTQTYNVTLTADIDGSCKAQVIKTVTVYELPVCDFTISSGWTPGFGFRTIDLAATNTTYPFYQYKISDGGVVNGATGSYQFATDGIYDITLIARNAADCECTQTQKRYQQNSLGTTSIDGENIDVYPNPSTGAIYVNAQSTIKTINVYDVLGNLVLSNSGNGSNKYTFNLGEKSNGIYLVKVSTDNGTSTKRIVLNK